MAGGDTAATAEVSGEEVQLEVWRPPRPAVVTLSDPHGHERSHPWLILCSLGRSTK